MKLLCGILFACLVQTVLSMCGINSTDRPWLFVATVIVAVAAFYGICDVFSGGRK